MAGPRYNMTQYWILLTFILVAGVTGQNYPPEFSEGTLDSFVLSEDHELGRIKSLHGRDRDEDRIFFTAGSSHFEVQNERDLYLIRELDYETATSHRINLTLSDGKDQVGGYITVFVDDVNDNRPEFRGENYSEVGEGAFLNQEVYGITVVDADVENNILDVSCMEGQSEGTGVDPCDYFDVVRFSADNQEWTGAITVKRTLDYEKQSSYVVYLYATDGDNSRIQPVTIKVVDEQDTPPQWNNVNSVRLEENMDEGAILLCVNATDGDRGNPRYVRYRLLTNPGELFRINSETGCVTAAEDISLNDPIFAASYNSLLIEAEEIGGEGEGDMARSQTTITIYTDVNNYRPTFDKSTIDVYMNEGIWTSSYTIPYSTLNIYDQDPGLNGEFEVTMSGEEENERFEISQPTIGTGSLSISILVKPGIEFDYDQGDRTYILNLVARETRTADAQSGQAQVIVHIQDTNDHRPYFEQDFYPFTVPETASGDRYIGTIVANDLDASGPFGPESIRYKLSPRSSLFWIDPNTGDLYTQSCDTPGVAPCLDAETQLVHELTVYAADSYGEGFIISVPVEITVLDDNDNAPKFRVGNYTSFIQEDETDPDPPVELVVKDPDSSSVNSITYTIVSGNEDNIWYIDNDNGRYFIRASRPVKYEDTDYGYFLMTVKASDGLYDDTITVIIYVTEGNNHSPRFIPTDVYEVTISEDTPGGTYLLTVTALDNDPSSSPNGQVLYRFGSGTDGKYSIDEISGIIVTTPDATFDYQDKNRYVIVVWADDQGSPQRSTPGTVIVNIRDSNNEKPYFDPSLYEEEVKENTPVGASVVIVTAKDPDPGAVLAYEFIAGSAYDRFGNLVGENTDEILNMFDIGYNTGLVTVGNPLNRQEMASFSYTIQATDTAAVGDPQTATATLLITVIDVNDRPPVFENGDWTVDNPNIYVTVREDYLVDSYVTTIIATDPDGYGIESYRITTNPGGYFEINSQTGVVTLKNPIDYETVQSTVFVVEATDRGEDPLSSTATVYVTVLNVNDHDPIFSQDTYRGEISENAQKGDPVLQLDANDRDRGDYGEIRYSIDDPHGTFGVDPYDGRVFVNNPSGIDREVSRTMTYYVRATDSPNNPDEARQSFAQIRISIEDYNDNPPRFTETTYTASVPETTPPDSSVVTVEAEDGDQGNNGKVVYYIMGGNDDNLFKINQDTGEITTVRELTPPGTYLGDYNLTVEARDLGSPQLVSTAFVLISIVGVNNGPPVWTFPQYNNETIYVLEEQYDGMVVTGVQAVDTDEGENGIVNYGFIVDGEERLETDEFRINPITGIITALVVLDRETEDTYILTLNAKDNGDPSLSSTIILTIKVDDIDDHLPEFPTYRNCCTIMYTFEVTENEASGILVGQVSATDLDIGQNSETVYTIVDGNEADDFRIDAVTGQIFTTDALDHEELNNYELLVTASNERSSSSSAQLGEECTCTTPNEVIVIIKVVNKNDFKPEFPEDLYKACVSIDAPFYKHVTTVTAIDNDDPVNTPIGYEIDNVRLRSVIDGTRDDADDDTFGIYPNATIYTNALMSPYEDSYFEMDVIATDLTDPNNPLWDSTVVKVWVTEPHDEVKIIMDSDVAESKAEIDDIVKWLEDQLPAGSHVCVRDITSHVTEETNIDKTRSDIYFYVIDGNEDRVMRAKDALDYIWTGDNKDDPYVDVIAVADMEPAYDLFDGFDIDPVLIAVIIIFILLLLALLLLCLCWCWPCCACCAGAGKGKKKKALYLDAMPMMMPSGTVNPLWKLEYEDQEINMDMGGMVNAGYDDTDLKVPNGTAMQLALPAGGGVTETKTETTNEYSMQYERTQTTQEIIGGGSSGGPTPRIEAELEPRPGDSDSGIRSNSGIQTSVRSTAMMTNQVSHTQASYPMPPAIPIQSLQDPHVRGPSGIGAVLLSSQTDLSQFSNYSEQASPQYDGFTTTWPRGYSAGQTIHTIDGGYQNDFPDGMYQGEILLGTYRQSEPQYHDAYPAGYEMDTSYH